jgi:tetratricopeptide (TPR) repeat protein
MLQRPMNRLAQFVVAVVLASPALGQTGQAPAPSPAQATPDAPQATPPESSTTPRKVAAKTKAEFDAYTAADTAIKTDPDPIHGETAAADFAAKFPQSKLTSILYQELMVKFQRADNAPKTVAWGRKVIAIDASSVLAMITVANTLAETTNETDLDWQERYDEVLKDANHAIQLIDSGSFKPPITLAQLNSVEAMAYAAMGSIEFTKSGDGRDSDAERARHDTAAEQALRKATQLNTESPEPSIWLRYAITLDHEKKYSEGLAAANRAVELSSDNATVLALASQEQSRLKELAAPGAVPSAPSGQHPPQ